MTSREIHVASTVPVAFLAVAVGHHPVVAVPLLAGALVPELDAFDRDYHRSWLLHTFLLPALLYQALVRSGAAAVVPAAVETVHFLAVGMGLHFFADYVYPRTASNPGAAWPVRPTLRSAPWGLLWLGIAWTVQWFGYIVPALGPWLVGG